MTDSISILDQYRSKSKIAAEAVSQADGRAYKAYDIQPPRTRCSDLRLVYADGRIGLMAKSYRTEVIVSSHQHLSLIFNDAVITLEGRHLNLLVDLLQDDEVRSLHCFNGRLHEMPPDDEILITKMERKNIYDYRVEKKATQAGA